MLLIIPIPFIYVLYQFFKRLKIILKDPELRGTMVMVGIILLLGMIFYHRAEGWTWLDSLYFSVVTLTTIGYGDLAPQTSAGKIFTILYILLGLGVLAVFISTVAEHTLEEQRQQAKAKEEKKKAEQTEKLQQPAPADLQTVRVAQGDGEATLAASVGQVDEAAPGVQAVLQEQPGESTRDESLN